jgi:hypothetical protein
VKFNRSKNVLEKRDAPWQTILGSLDLSFCVLLNLLLWLELSSQRFSPSVSNFSTDVTVPSRGISKGENRPMDVFRVILHDLQLELDLQEGEVGTQSICKKCCASRTPTGLSKDDKATWGR